MRSRSRLYKHVLVLLLPSAKHKIFPVVRLPFWNRRIDRDCKSKVRNDNNLHRLWSKQLGFIHDMLWRSIQFLDTLLHILFAVLPKLQTAPLNHPSGHSRVRQSLRKTFLRPNSKIHYNCTSKYWETYVTSACLNKPIKNKYLQRWESTTKFISQQRTHCWKMGLDHETSIPNFVDHSKS